MKELYYDDTIGLSVYMNENTVFLFKKNEGIGQYDFGSADDKEKFAEKISSYGVSALKINEILLRSDTCTKQRLAKPVRIEFPEDREFDSITSLCKYYGMSYFTVKRIINGEARVPYKIVYT